MGHFAIWSIMSSPEDIRGLAMGGVILFLCVTIVSVFSFISIVVWTEARRKEREAYYKAESMRRIGESSGDGGKYVLEMMREEERIRVERERLDEFKKHQGIKIGGLVNIGVGAGLMIFLYFLTSNNSGPGRFTFLVGLIPGFVGVALLISGRVITPRGPQG